MFLELSYLSSKLHEDLDNYIARPPAEVCDELPPFYVKVIAAQRLLQEFERKFVSSSDDADAEAAKTFFTSNKKCEGWVDPRTKDISETDALLVGQFLSEVDNFFNVWLGDDCDLSWGQVSLLARTGPGSSIGAVDTSWYAKMCSSRLTTTSESLYRLYKAGIALDPESSNAEIIRTLDCGSPDTVRGSRSCFVPKNVDISRQISVEPILNQYFQLGLGSLIEKRLFRYFGVSLSDQPTYNRWLARRGSVEYAGTGENSGFATIDLKSASDCISLGLCSLAIPPQWMDVLLSLRSPETKIDESWHKLHMMSTMGCGFTFPLQTALFSCVVAACYALSDKSPVLSGRNANAAVFGDDIIVTEDVAERCVRLLSLLGFEVNTAKSFLHGAFKESCGHDYYHGYNIRAFYCRKLDNAQDLYVLFNLAQEWSARTGIPLQAFSEYILDYLPRHQRHFVPLGEEIGSGFRIPRKLIPKLRYNRNGSYIYRAIRAKPKGYRIGDNMIVSPRGKRSLVYNPSGLLLAFLKGEVRGCRILTRTSGKSVPWDLGKRVWPHDWDYIPFDAARLLDEGLGLANGQLATATYRNCVLSTQFE